MSRYQCPLLCLLLSNPEMSIWNSLALLRWGCSYSTPSFFIIFSCSVHENYNPHYAFLSRPVSPTLCRELFLYNRTVSNPGATGRIAPSPSCFLRLGVSKWILVVEEMEREVFSKSNTHIVEKWVLFFFLYLFFGRY